jgi:hypothetical protein
VVPWSWRSKDNYQPLVTHWASHGYVVIQPTHSDSRSLGTKIGDALRFQDWQSRPADVSFVLDSLDELEKQVPRSRAGSIARRLAWADTPSVPNTLSSSAARQRFRRPGASNAVSPTLGLPP